MKITEHESNMIFSALRDQANHKEAHARMMQIISLDDPNKDAADLLIEATALRILASKIAKAQEVDDHVVSA
ncbi:hypothetical protein ACO0K9_01060 [Undibacterium sp. Ji50W]|uniref:hypothetical protein n=1 Tax=Undibacterium sp. Ji50W TaxID=3413041 RepID=UPI003BF3EC73